MDILHLIGRSEELFTNDIARHEAALSGMISGSSFLVIGGAGSIGQAVVKEIFKRQPKVLHVVDISENKVVCQFQVKNDNLFVSEGRLMEPGIIENMAQTIAAGAGYRAKAKNEKVKLGYIAAIKNLDIYALPSVGDILSTSVEIVNEVFSVTIVQAEVICGNTRIADCEMRIFIEEEKKAIF